MVVPVSKFDGEVEDEFIIDLCCASCAYSNLKWTPAQFEFVVGAARKSNPIPVPSHINEYSKFIEFIANSVR